MLRIGRVSGVEPATCRVRVAFEADEGLVSFWLPVLQRRTLGDRSYWMPEVDEQVACLLDEHAEDGYVLGGFYSRADPPPVTSADRAHVAIKDGAVIEYDRAAHRLTVDLRAAGGDVVLLVPAGKHVHVGGEGGKQLATVDFVNNAYLKHVHPTPAGASGPPIATGTEAQWPQVTQKGRSE
ncbi:MAG: hypothetical protein AVDCRST_MAG89-5115 [uncultured Gemmatimonadetes bacterium]|uniref:Gp5/Type VI secretion system Vgr protein OB-fold domain-containing protein n=1 Tax=uncultured Gemmatimonadota bacterium TaxID=203437 RepID=A0A6J4NAI7_9BACT|nr:MAG: hypothetical protein AVDCRST_MAG89-5115 [uncultured Gemmatimonadota bacterium]